MTNRPNTDAAVLSNTSSKARGVGIYSKNEVIKVQTNNTEDEITAITTTKTNRTRG